MLEVNDSAYHRHVGTVSTLLLNVYDLTFIQRGGGHGGVKAAKSVRLRGDFLLSAADMEVRSNA